MKKSFWKLYNEVIEDKGISDLKEYIIKRLNGLINLLSKDKNIKNSNLKRNVLDRVYTTINFIDYKKTDNNSGLVYFIQSFKGQINSLLASFSLIHVPSSTMNYVRGILEDIINDIDNSLMDIDIAGDIIEDPFSTKLGIKDETFEKNYINVFWHELRDILLELQFYCNNIDRLNSLVSNNNIPQNMNELKQFTDEIINNLDNNTINNIIANADIRYINRIFNLTQKVFNIISKIRFK